MKEEVGVAETCTNHPRRKVTRSRPAWANWEKRREAQRRKQRKKDYVQP